MEDIQSATAEIRQGKKEERKKQDKNIMSASATQAPIISTRHKVVLDMLRVIKVNTIYD